MDASTPGGMGFKLDEGIPIPENTYKGRTATYPWEYMKPGVSFLVKPKVMDDESGAVEPVEKVLSRMRSAIQSRQKKMSKAEEYTARIDEKQKDCVRVWRVK
jgi:hypothetical protein